MTNQMQDPYISPNVFEPRKNKAKKKMKKKARLTKKHVVTGIALSTAIMAANPDITAFAKEQSNVLVNEPSKVIPNVKTEVLAGIVKSSVVETVAPKVQENIAKENPAVMQKIAKDIKEAKEKGKEPTVVSKKVEKMVASAPVNTEKPKEEQKQQATAKKEEVKKEEQKKQEAVQPAPQKVEEKKEEAPKVQEISDAEKVVKEAYRMYEAYGVNSANRMHYSMPKRDLEEFGDCSEFTMNVYKKALGMDIGYNTIEQITNGKENFHFGKNKLSELQPGDIMYFNSPGGHELSRNINGNKISVDHTGIYVGDNTFIDMSAGQDGISVKKFGSGDKYAGYVTQSFIGYNRLASSEKKEVTQQTEEQKQDTLTFDPVKEYGSNFNSLLGTLTEKEAKAIENSMIRPVPKDTYGDVSSKYGPRTLNGEQNFHHGLDYPAPIGTPVYAAADGKVIYSGKAGGYGNWIVLEHNINGVTLYTIYGHMKADDLYVKEGDTVKQGQKITAVHTQGQSTGAHLHFSVAKTRDAKAPRVFQGYISPSYTVDVSRSDSYTYEGHEAKQQEEKKEDNGVVDKQKYWKDALEASKQTGWHPIFIMSQWEIETTHFTSANFRNNNNLAGQTWYPGSPYPKGTKRPANEGGYYIKYPSAVEGYVDFIKRNPRYKHVKDFTTPEEQAHEVAQQGWAVGPEQYEKTLLALIKQNREKYGDVGIQTPEQKPAETQPEAPKTEQPAEKQEEVKQETPKQEEQKKEEVKQETPKKEEEKKEDTKKEETKKEDSKKETDGKKDSSSNEKEKESTKAKEEDKKKDSEKKEEETKKESSDAKEEKSKKADTETKEKEKEKIEVEKEEKDTVPFIFEQFFK